MACYGPGSMIAFEFLKPECVSLCKTRDVESIKRLKTKIEVVPAENLDEILQYVLFPFRVILKESRNIKSDMFRAMSECLTMILTKCVIMEWKVFEDIFLIMCIKLKTIFDKDPLAEDNLFALVNCLTALVGHSASPLCNSFYSANNMPLLGSAVHCLLAILKKTEARHLKIACLNSLQQICCPSYIENLDEGSQSTLKCKIGNVIASFLPGTTSAVAVIVPSDINLGGKIKCACLKLLACIITMTLGDKYLQPCAENSDLKENLKSFCVYRNETWVNSTSTKLQPIFNVISSASASSDWKVRFECLEFFERMLTECKSSLKMCTSIFIATPVKLLNDDYKSVAQKASTIMNKFSTEFHINSKSDNDYIIEIFKNNLLSLINDFPIILRKAADEEKISKLNLVLGYTTLLKESINTLYILPIFQKKFNIALQDCLEIDPSSINIIDYVLIEENMKRMKLRYTHFRDKRVLICITKLLHCLGQYADFNTLTDYFTDVYLSSNSSCQQALLILNELMVGAKNFHREDLKCFITEFLNILVLPEHWNIITSQDSCYHSTHTEKPRKLMLTMKSDIDINHNILLASLQLESILIFSEVLRGDFKIHLQTALYPLLEKCCDENPVVATRAKSVLYGIAVNCGYSGIHDLISNNADYIISTISLQLINLSFFPRCPSALRSVLDLCDERILPLVRDTIDEILVSLDIHHFNDNKLLLFLPVLASILNSLKKFSNTEKFVDKKTKKDAKESLNEFIQNHHRQCQIASLEQEPKPDSLKNSNRITEEDSGGEYESNEEQIEIIPAEVKIAEQVLMRCKNLISHHSPRVRICVLGIISNGIVVLSAHENSLLPMAHKLWAPLLPRLNDKEVQVVMQAFKSICVMSEYCGQFLRKRICSDVLPKVLQFMKLQTKLHCDTNSFLTISTSSQVAWKQTMTFKMQKKVLHDLGPLLTTANVSNNDIRQTCQICYKYLSSKQPQDLQDAAISLFKHIIDIDKDIVWLFLNDICCTETLTPPEVPTAMKNLKFDKIKVRGDTDKNNVYYKNISLLIKLC